MPRAGAQPQRSAGSGIAGALGGDLVGALPGPYDGRVPDLKPPRVSAGERETLLALLQYQRDSLVRKVTGVDEGAAQQPVVGSGTTLLWLVLVSLELASGAHFSNHAQDQDSKPTSLSL